VLIGDLRTIVFLIAISQLFSLPESLPRCFFLLPGLQTEFFSPGGSQPAHRHDLQLSPVPLKYYQLYVWWWKKICEHILPVIHDKREIELCHIFA
jgi:hypothetical protein